MIGEVVDGHEIVRAIGTGGMGEVYLARTAAGELRAIKIVRADREADRQSAARFRREVDALGKLRHEGIVQLVGAGRLPSGALYLAMEYVDGEDLQAAVTDGGALGVGATVAVMARVAAALAYAHERGVVHRDLKPGNVLLAGGDPGRVKIIDFGLAKIYAAERLTVVTDENQMLGSPLYWAPEQCTSAAVGPEADVYALGAIAYFALTGAPMFRPRPAVGLVYAHQHEAPEPLAARCEGIAIPAELAQLVQACVAKAPGERPPAGKLARELAALGERVPAERARRRETRAGDEAAHNQIRQIALELAAVLAIPTDELDGAQTELADLELELAMEPDDAALARAASVLRRRIEVGYRELVDAVVAARAAAPAEAAGLYGEVGALFARVGGGP